MFESVGGDLLDACQIDGVRVPLFWGAALTPSHRPVRSIRNLTLRNGGHMVLLHSVRPRRQIDLVEVEGDVRARILALTMRIVQLLIIIHVLAAARARLEIARLVSGCRRSLCRGLRQLLMESLIVNGRFDNFSIGCSRG